MGKNHPRDFEVGISVSIVSGAYSLESLSYFFGNNLLIWQSLEGPPNWLLRVRKLHGIAEGLSWRTKILFSFLKY